MKVDLLIAEIGSTTTIVNAFDGVGTDDPRFVGQGMSETSIAAGDVNIGLKKAMQELSKNLAVTKLSYDDFLATSSAAGGLAMTVHGLVHDMTVKAAKEAALGSGAVLRCLTAGKLRKSDLARIKEAKPRIIMIAGGVDYGERETSLHNFDLIASEKLNIPLLYSGNIENRAEIREIAEEYAQPYYITENVYPSIDSLNITPCKRLIQQIFEEHIVEAPGMADIRKLLHSTIMPTPGAVMAMAELFYEEIGDLVVLDVGGATTDVHAVTLGNEKYRDLQISPEPFAKRTVEGDLGVYVNRSHVFSIMNDQEKSELSRFFANDLGTIPEIPQEADEMAAISLFAKKCAAVGIDRHAGKLSELYTPQGRLLTVCGKDLSAVKTVIMTGGALTRLPGAVENVKDILRKAPTNRLYPAADAAILPECDYLMASLGAMAQKHRSSAIKLMKSSLRID